MKNILYIGKYNGIIGGIERYMQKSAMLLRKNGFSVHYLYTENSGKEQRIFAESFNSVQQFSPENELIKTAEENKSNFPKEPIFREELRERFSGKQKGDGKKMEGFDKLALKVGKIIEIERHPKADKLYVEKVDMGNGEIRQIVSGLVPYFTEDELKGKNVVIAYNLKAAKLRGVMSEGMVLAAENEAGTVELLSPDCQPGEWVSIEGSTPNTEEITVDDFFSVPLEVKSNQAQFEGKNLMAAGNVIKLEKVVDGKIG
jgi:methionyl-tRNA synthetase